MLIGDQGTAFPHPVKCRLDPCAEHTVAAAQMVVEKGQRCPDREAVQPERDLGEFHRHRVKIDSVHAALEYHAANDVAVIQLFFDDRPVMRARVGDDCLSQLGDVLDQRRSIFAPGHAFSIANRSENLV